MASSFPSVHQHPHPRYLTHAAFPQHVSSRPALSLLIKSHSPSLSLDCIFDIFIPYPSRWNLVVRSLSTTQSNHSLREALLLELELSIFLRTVSRTSISIYHLFTASIAEPKRNVAVLPHTQIYRHKFTLQQGLCLHYNTIAQIAVKQGGKRVDTPTSTPIRYI
jgi:hypothetical protein